MPTAAYKEDVDPRKWFVERIRSQAKTEGIEFTPFEQEYLFHTEQGDDAAAVKMLDKIKGKEYEDFDQRISGLAWRKYQSDIQSDPNAKEQYDNARHALANVDEYPNLSTLICCIGLETPPEELNRKGSWRLPLVIVLIMLALIIMAILRR